MSKKILFKDIVVTDLQDNPIDAPLNNNCAIATGKSDDTILGVANSSSNANATSEAQLTSDDLTMANANSESSADALAIGIKNTGKITTGKGNDTILGIANASAKSVSTATFKAKLIFGNVADADAVSNSLAIAEAVAISNSGKIATGRGHDMMIGIANASALGVSIAISQAELVFDDNSLATAKSESVSVVNSLAIGIDNLGAIATGQGDDIIIGVASTWALSEAEATAFANNAAVDSKTLNEIKTAISQSTSKAMANSNTNALGIINSGAIFTGQGNDLIFGLANNRSLSNSLAISQAESMANDVAIATADAKSLTISQGSTVGIVNQGTIVTGQGNDAIVGIAVNKSAVDANADADALATANDSDVQTNTNAIADNSGAIAIGIDNTKGVIKTEEGDDLIIGYGAVGIKGGKIQTGRGRDRIIGYGSTVGIEDSEIRLGQGNDYLQAAIVDFNSFTEESLSANQSGSIKNAAIFGDGGNDTFEIGGFAATVLIDGGRDYDVLKLWGNIDNYAIARGLADNQLIIDDSDSTLVVENVEAFYFGNSDRLYSFNDFA